MRGKGRRRRGRGRGRRGRRGRRRRRGEGEGCWVVVRRRCVAHVQYLVPQLIRQPLELSVTEVAQFRLHRLLRR